MHSSYRNIYPDSDFFPDSFAIQPSVAIDLTKVKIYDIHGEAMLKLADLKALNIPIRHMKESTLDFPKAA
jgi:hypothetical protein